MRTGTRYIDGRELALGTGRSFDSIDPATGETLASVEAAGAAGVDRAVVRAAALLRARTDELALLECTDVGKPITEAPEVDVPTGADALEEGGAVSLDEPVE